MKILDVKAAVDKSWDKLKNTPAWQELEVKSKREVIDRAKKACKTVHVATLTDLCHLTKLRVGQEVPKYKGRVVLRGDVVKDHSSSYFTEASESTF